MIQELRHARFHKSDIDSRLRASWDAYTWDTKRIPAIATLYIWYVKLIQLGPRVITLTRLNHSLLDRDASLAFAMEVSTKRKTRSWLMIIYWDSS